MFAHVSTPITLRAVREGTTPVAQAFSEDALTSTAADPQREEEPLTINDDHLPQKLGWVRNLG